MNDELPKITELEILMCKVDWESATEQERLEFTSSFTFLELSKINRIRYDAIKHGRMSSLLVNCILVMLLLLLHVNEGIVLVASIALQIAMFLLSQIFDFFSKNVMKQAEKTVLDSVKKLARKYPSDKQ